MGSDWRKRRKVFHIVIISLHIRSKISGFPVKSLTTKKQTTKFSSAKLKKKYIQAISYSEFKDEWASSEDLDEMAQNDRHYEPSHQDLRC